MTKNPAHLHCSLLYKESPAREVYDEVGVRLQFTAPPTDARRQAREARKAAPDTAGK